MSRLCPGEQHLTLTRVHPAADEPRPVSSCPLSLPQIPSTWPERPNWAMNAGCSIAIQSRDFKTALGHAEQLRRLAPTDVRISALTVELRRRVDTSGGQ